jgi:hypothetical protein
MTSDRPVNVYPPDRRVRVDRVVLGRAYSVLDVARFMQETGLQKFNKMDVVRSAPID